jgi:hypothetical protein
VLAQFPMETRSSVGFSPSTAVRAVTQVTIAHRFVRRYEFVLTPSEEAKEARVLSWQPLAL